jgi:hypothetical protein
MRQKCSRVPRLRKKSLQRYGLGRHYLGDQTSSFRDVHFTSRSPSHPFASGSVEFPYGYHLHVSHV